MLVSIFNTVKPTLCQNCRLSLGMEINTLMTNFTLASGLLRGVDLLQGGLSKGVPLNEVIIQKASIQHTILKHP